MKKVTALVFALALLIPLTGCDNGVFGPDTADLPLVVVNSTDDRTGEVVANGEATGVVLAPGESRQFEVNVRVGDRSYGPDQGDASIYLRDVDNGKASDVRSVRLSDDEIVTVVFESWDHVRVLY